MNVAASSSPLSLLLLRDRRAGHFRQSEGVALALSKRFAVTVTTVACQPPGFFASRFGRRLLRLAARLSPALFDRLCGLDLAGVARPELIVSAGADTLAANVALARRYTAANVFIGTVREYPEDAFAAALTIYPSQAVRPRHILTLKPTPFDPDTLPAPRPVADAGDLAGREAALFVGGPSGTHRWHADDWRRLEALVRETGERFGLCWRITTSRRTPAEATARLKALADAPFVREVIDFAEAGPGSADRLFAADILVVTEDSATMAMEAVAARRPVVALCPADRDRSRDDEAIDGLVAERRLERLELGGADAADFAAAIAALSPLEDNPLTRLAGLLLPLLPARFSQG